MWAKWTTLKPLTGLLETLFEDGERVEGGMSSRDVKKVYILLWMFQFSF
jgi:hypothetical protein